MAYQNLSIGLVQINYNKQHREETETHLIVQFEFVKIAILRMCFTFPNHFLCVCSVFVKWTRKKTIKGIIGGYILYIRQHDNIEKKYDVLLA